MRNVCMLKQVVHIVTAGFWRDKYHAMNAYGEWTYRAVLRLPVLDRHEQSASRPGRKALALCGQQVRADLVTAAKRKSSAPLGTELRFFDRPVRSLDTILRCQITNPTEDKNIARTRFGIAYPTICFLLCGKVYSSLQDVYFINVWTCQVSHLISWYDILNLPRNWISVTQFQ
jgi:hypothetical protein